MNTPSKAAEKLIDVAVIGAGPAGLTAAYLLSKKGFSVTVIEKDPKYVGGLSRNMKASASILAGIASSRKARKWLICGMKSFPTTSSSVHG